MRSTANYGFDPSRTRTYLEGESASFVSTSTPLASITIDREPEPDAAVVDGSSVTFGAPGGYTLTLTDANGGTFEVRTFVWGADAFTWLTDGYLGRQAAGRIDLLTENDCRSALASATHDQAHRLDACTGTRAELVALEIPFQVYGLDCVS